MELDLGLEDVREEQGPKPEPTVLEYARFHRLCNDYTQEKMPYGSITPPPDEVIDHDLCDPPDAPILTDRAHELTKEPIAISNQSAFLLRSIFSLSQSLDKADIICDGKRQIRGLKQEVPLLRSDNELDLLNFGSTATPNLTDLKIPLEICDEEKDEGLEWPSRYWVYPVEKDEWAKAESSRLEMRRQDMIGLQDAVKDTYAPEDGEQIKKETLQYKRSTALQPLTPPLLPLSPPMTPYVPSSPACHLQLLSEDSNSTAAEARTLENQIMGEDSLFKPDSNGSDQMLLDMTEGAHLSPTPDELQRLSIFKRKVEDLKVETPLTPPMFSGPLQKRLKTVTFADFPHYIDELPSWYESGNDVLCPEDDFAGFYEEVKPLAEEANWRAENENLSEADTTKRVDIPKVDFTLPVAPWEVHKRSAGDSGADLTELDAQSKFILQVKRALGAMSWHGLSKLDRELPSVPFSPQSMKVTVNENLHGEDNSNSIILEFSNDDVVTSSAGIWKRDGLRLLEDDEEAEEELEQVTLQEHRDVDALIRKRKLEMDEEAADAERRRRVSPAAGPSRASERPVAIRVSAESLHCQNARPGQLATPLHRHNAVKPQHRNKPDATKALEIDGSLMFGGMFSAGKAMDKFMAMQGMEAKPRKVDDDKNAVSSHFSATAKTFPIRSRSHSIHAEPEPEQEAVAPPPLPKLPSVPQNLPPCSIIISDALLQQRPLTKQIEKLYPNAEFVGRDFSLPHSVAREADLLLSPSTGLILTTLQQVKQRALPGQSDSSKLKERIAALQHRYERLIVMISEGLSREMEERGSGRPVDARDWEAISVYEKLASKMEGDVLVRFVSGGDQALARSVVLEMAKYGLMHGSRDIGDIKPLPDETNWELFLRRAGLNPFAAQVILAWLKDHAEYSFTSSPGAPSQTISTFGLQTFLMMSTQERVQSFQALLGGTRILTRVSALLDQEWVSAAHGYRM